VPKRGEISIGKYRYRVEISGGEVGYMKTARPSEAYKIEHVLEAKNVYYF